MSKDLAMRTFVQIVLLCLAPALVLRAAPEAVTLIANGRADGSIVVPGEPTVTERFAAEELQKYLLQMTGVMTPIVSEGAAPAGVIVHVGRTRAGLSALEEHEMGRRDADAFVLTAQNNRVVAVGNCDRSTIYAVYDLLERAGCVWPAPGVDHVPKRTDFRVANLAHVEEPALKYRCIRHIFPTQAAAGLSVIHIDWAVKMRTNREVWGGDGLPTAHSEHILKRGGPRAVTATHILDQILTPELAEKHPQFLAEIDGKRTAGRNYQICTSAPGVAEFFAERLAEVVKRFPHLELFAITQADGTRWCQCAQCAAKDSGAQWRRIGDDEDQRASYPVVTERWIEFVNQVVARLSEQFPKQRFYTLAYNQTQTPPAKADCRPHPHLTITLTHKGCFTHSFERVGCAPNAEWLRQLDAWLALTPAGVIVYDYYPGSNFLQLPYMAYRKVFSDLRAIVRRDVIGFEASNSRIRGTYHVTQYAIAQAMWNPNRDVDGVMDRFFEGLYGSAAPHVKALCEFLESSRESFERHDGGLSGTTYLSSGILRAAEPLVAEALKAAPDATIRDRIQALADHVALGRGYCEAMEAFAQYGETNDVARLEAAVARMRDLRALADEVTASRNSARNQLGIVWRNVVQGPKSIVGTSLPQWERLLAAARFEIPRKPGVKVGIYGMGLGADAVTSALVKVAGLNAFSIPTLNRQSLDLCDVVVVANCGPHARVFNRFATHMRPYVERRGKGIMLLHDAVGYRDHETLFPDVGAGARVARLNKVGAATQHPITRNMPIGTFFRHQFQDHVVIEPGPAGQVVFRNEAGDPVVVAGAAGRGRVILAGMLSGVEAGLMLGETDRREPADGELDLLVRGIRWLAEADR